MKWPKIPTLKMPKWNVKFPKLFKSSPSFYSIWKKFVRQIPPESRSLVKEYQHFIVLGDEKSGKTQLIEGLIEQSQDLYPFDTTYTASNEVQFYLGPRQVIQEMSFATLENRTIKVRKKVIRLWKKLYAEKSPIILITYDCCSRPHDQRESNKLAQLVAGKISLLTEIVKKPVKVRIALPFLDKIDGYLEFAHFLKQQNINFTIPLSMDFETQALARYSQSFIEEHLSLILTTTSYENYLKIIAFFKKMPLHFSAIEEFMRGLISRVSFTNSIELDLLSYTSNYEKSSSFNSFQWTKIAPSAIFFRYPLLKHQIASVCLFVIGVSLLFNSYFLVRHELQLVRKGTESLDLLQFKFFENSLIPELDQLSKKASGNLLSYLDLHFFNQKLEEARNDLSYRIRKYFIESEFRKTILENKGECKYLYFLALINASNSNNLGKFILKDSKPWANALHINEQLIRTYVKCSSKPLPSSYQTINRVNPFLPLTSLNPWLSFMKRFQEVIEQPILLEPTFENIVKEIDKLLPAVDRIRQEPLVFATATLLDEKGIKENESIQAIQWIGENIDALENFLLFLKQTSIPHPDIQGMNISQFFSKLKEISALSELENESYNFIVENHTFSFDSHKWTNLVSVNSIEQAIGEYITANTDTGGSIFFNNTPDSADTSLLPLQASFSFFKTQNTVPGRFSRMNYEKRVRSTTEKLSHLIDSLPINPEEKKRFTNFLVRETVNYIKTYQAKYLSFFDSYDVEVNTLNNLKKLFHDLTQPSSNFYEFLHTIQHQTSVLSEPILSLTHMEELNDFDFLNRIFEQKDDVAPISEYQKLISQLINDLESSSPVENTQKLFPHLTPAARVSFNILKQTTDSYLVKVHQCLQQMGIPERFHEPFYKPILLLHKFGLVELKNSINTVWKTQFGPKIDHFFSQFPFNFQSSELASVDEVKMLLSPKGEFSNSLNEIRALCSYQDNQWGAPNPDHLQIEPKIYHDLNQLSRLSNSLLDAEGNPKPLNIQIHAVPTTVSPDTPSAPVLSYLVLGAHSVYNFNQDPSWQPISIEWWKFETSLIGIELINRKTQNKTYRTTHVINAPWGFFSLLKLGVQQKDLVWVWGLASHEETDFRKVSFRFDQDPRTILQISQLGSTK